MRIRLTDISLDLPDRRLEVGEPLQVGEDIPEELAEARLSARTALIIGDDDRDLTQAVSDALAGVLAMAGSLRSTIVILLDAVEAGTEDDALEVFEAFEDLGPVMFPFRERMSQLQDRAYSRRRSAPPPAAAKAADPAPASTSTASSTGAGEGAAGDTVAPETPAFDPAKPLLPQLQVALDAAKDNRPPNEAGVEVAAPAVSAEPAAVVVPEVKAPARKGAAEPKAAKTGA